MCDAGCRLEQRFQPIAHDASANGDDGIRKGLDEPPISTLESVDERSELAHRARGQVVKHDDGLTLSANTSHRTINPPVGLRPVARHTGPEHHSELMVAKIG